jgi:hypothetical protein
MSIYDCKHARFDHARPLTEDELRKVAPSVFAVTAHESRSDRFAVIPTIEVLHALSREGFQVVAAQQSTTRSADKRDYTKHMLRIRRFGDGKQYAVGDSVFEIILKNANDGTSAYDLMGGLFRIRCLNSLVAAESTIDTVKVYHKGNVANAVIDGTYSVIDSAEKALVAPQDWSQLRLTYDDKMAFAEAAHDIRFGEEDRSIEPRVLLHARRQSDATDDLWTTFNRVQENVIVGGLVGQSIDNRGRQRRRTTREITGIDQDVRLNRALWKLGEYFSKMWKVA